MIAALPCRFNAEEHRYTRLDTGQDVRSTTQMLWQTGWIDDRWYTDECRQRGTAVHDLTYAYDLGAVNLKTCSSGYLPYLLGHIKVLEMVRPQFLEVEQASIVAVDAPVSRQAYGTRTDRLGMVYGLKAVWELKSGAPELSHGVQLALQAIHASVKFGIPPEMIARFAEYLTDKGKGKLLQYKDPRDFTGHGSKPGAWEIIRSCT